MNVDDETPSVFLAQLCETLKFREGVDTGLAGIVAMHILALTPSADCVEAAMTAINKLAASRACISEQDIDG